MATKTDELFTQITDRLIAEIETGGHGKWSKPWTQVIAGSGIGTNAQTHLAYKGFNQFILMVTAAAAGYTIPIWATYKQWIALGGQVKRGEHGTVLVKWGVTYRCHGCDYRSGKAPCPKKGHLPDEYWWASPFTVFNVAQQEGFAYELPDLGDEPTRLKAVEDFIEATGAEIKHLPSNEAFYSRITDVITLPLREQFTTPEGYYGTALHELTHWTGHDSRLAREMGKRFGDNAYAAEELVAELGATFLAARHGVETEPHIEHARYLSSWLTVLRADSKNLYHAAKAAQEAADFLTGSRVIDKELVTS
jgi:antirestriction protein ArdC